MKANEIRRKFRFLITGMTLAAMVTSMAACSSASTGSAGGSTRAAEETTAEAVAENTEETAEENTTAAATEKAPGETAAADSTEEAAEADTSANTTETAASASIQTGPVKEDIETRETVENSEDSSHAVTADGEEVSMSNTAVIKTGDSGQGDEADFYGDNAAVFAAKPPYAASSAAIGISASMSKAAESETAYSSRGAATA